jgi:orotidine-5'-phosphate decarboxylase
MQQNSTLAQEKIMVALDVPDEAGAMEKMRLFSGHLNTVKIGLQLFTALGPGIVAAAKDMGFRVFLDLKLHDIPNTVAHAVESAIRHDVDFLTVHTLGGPAMLRAASEAAGDSGLKLLGVTLLTSMDEGECLAVGLSTDTADQVLRLARLAKDCGLHGCVASPLETALLRQELGPDFLLVIPGIRPAGAAAGDQRRILTPGQAIAAGASYLVVGRPLMASATPLETLRQINQEMEDALSTPAGR